MKTPSAPAGPYDLARVRYVTERFGNMQGLRLVPLGLWFLVMAAGEAELIPYVRQGALDVTFALLLIAGGASWLIGRHYDRRFGQVAPARSEAGSARLLAFVVGMFATGFVDARLEPPVSFTMCFFATVAFVYWYGPLQRRRHHWGALGIVYVALGLSPLVTGSLDNRLLDHVTQSTVLGVGLIVCGLLDHAMLARTLRPLPPEHA